ncbi:MAG: methionine adenosyltransferase domain-containing protein [Erysipelotrichaceae bacterium]|nr:methionine adenosyltransferase domain-containing protein [Erysipelotrichaceae bacterium]MBR2745802.1 methionine adenosyltransferase domain-containing protein [Erysipelotrichaceae bacterium]
MKLFSNEIVFRGHPDKVCDQISAAILDECLRQDPDSRCGVETVGGKGKIFITGEVTSKAVFSVEEVARRVLRDIGYRDDYEIIDNIGKQSADIALGTNEEAGGAGDQGMMFGYACNDTEELLPLAMVILQKLALKYDELVHTHKDFYPDGKAQITGEYDDDFNLVKIRDFTVSYNNSEENRSETDRILIDYITELCNGYGIEIEQFLINPTGKFLIGGFEGDAGLTGRKIVVDSYQSFANVGGGCMNGKDPSKVDLSGTYMARVYAVELLRKYNLKWCEVQLSYAIGLRRPLAIYIDSDKGNLEPEEQMYVRGEPKHIINELHMKEICYEKQAMYGHFHGWSI